MQTGNSSPALVDGSQLPSERNFPLDLWGQENPRSLINLVSDRVKEGLLAASKSHANLFGMDERELKKRVSPTPTDNRIRLAFWNEYNRAQETGKAMNMTNVYVGICSRQYFEDKYLNFPERVAWLACVPNSYSVIMEEALAYGIERVREILEIPFVMANGRVDSKAAELILKAVAMLDVRVKGAVVQKIEQKSLNMHLGSGAGDKSMANKALIGNMAEIEARIKYLEKKEKLILSNDPKAHETEVEAEVIENPDPS